MKLKFRPDRAYIKDTGLVVVLILQLIAYWQANLFFILLAIATLVVVMTVPSVFKPIAIAWHFLSIALGSITNRIILSVIFGAVLTPIGILRRSLGFDPMRRKEWKTGTHSVFTKRNHIFTGDDLNMPY